jgi:hypothetical protein
MPKHLCHTLPRTNDFMFGTFLFKKKRRFDREQAREDGTLASAYKMTFHRGRPDWLF